MRIKDRITKYSTQQSIPTSTNDSNIKPTPYSSVTNQNISPISWEFSDNNNGRWKRGFGNGCMRYEDGGESLENMVESGGGDGDECLALADLGASINLMPLSVWKEFSLPELTPTCMTLELADRSVSKPIGIAKDVKEKVGMFHFPADFVVVDFEPDPRVPLILGRCFLKTGRALIDVHKGELTLRIGNESITYNLDQTSRYSAKYDQMLANKIDVTDEAYEEYFQEVIGFSNVTASSSPTPSDDPIVSTTSPTLTLFRDSDFLLFEEANAFLAKTIKSSVDEPPEVELKDLPPHIEYVFLEGDNNLPVILAKELGEEEKAALIKVLESHKRAIAWKLSDIQ
nr:reverse transcriptase domain-containing protein [Tanacetum cinerariifolium]